MKKKKKNDKFKILFIITTLLIMLFSISRLVYAATVEKTTIICTDENMFNALQIQLKSILNHSAVNPKVSTDITNLSIQIPTEDIPSITEINLENKQITNINGIEMLTSLTKINLAKNKITNIDALQGINNITELNLNDNQNLGDNLSSVLSSMNNLNILNISRTGTRDISFVENLSSLKELYMANSSFNSLSSIEGLSLLNKLDVSGNQSLRTIQSILNLANLTYLNISNTGIRTLELDEDNNIGIYNLRKLKELYVSSVDIESLNPIVKSYYKEKHHLDEYGEWEGQDVAFLNQIEVLDISYVNRNEDAYVEVPSFSQLALMENLTKLYMEGNQLTNINEIYKLNKLQEVHLKDNKIQDLSGLVMVETEEEEGRTYEVVKEYLNATSIDLSKNKIKDISILRYLQGRVNIKDIDLSANSIYNTQYIEWINGNVKLQDQLIKMPIYKKGIELNQYILLLKIMQDAKNPNSKLYSENAEYITSGCELNNDPYYQEANLYNVVISSTKTEEDKITVELIGGIADGSVTEFIITDDSEIGIDSLLFEDDKLSSAIYKEINKIDEEKYLAYGGKILNVNHYIISMVEKLDLSNSNISDLSGLENFDEVKELNISKNINIKSISPLQYCEAIRVLNASETSIGNNIGAIEKMKHLKELILNNVGLTKIDSINNLIRIIQQNEEELTLEDLDLSANSLESLSGIENITSLKKLSATKNKLKVIPDLSDLSNLERLTMYSNNIEKMPKISDSRALKYIFLSDNKINDISELKKLTNITELDLNNNLLEDEDITQIKDIRVTSRLKIGGNSITDISQLKSSISSVTELDISKNKIKDVSVIDSRFSNNGDLTANNQKIAVALEQTTDDEVTYNLPQIFNAAKTSTSHFYTEEDFETQNCTISGQKVIINISELNDKAAIVKIKGGKADGTTLSIVAPINAVITYNTKEWTKEDVLANISFTNRSNVTITNNNGNMQYKFEKNGKFEFEYTDEYGMTGRTEAEVTWIDKEAPIISGIENNKVYESAVTPTINDNHGLDSVILIKNEREEQNYTLGTMIIDVGQYELVAKDLVNNETRISFTIKQKEPDPDPDPDPEPDPDPDTDEEITSDVYTIDDENRIITDIELKESVEDVMQKINCTSSYDIKGKNGKNLTPNDKVGTGCIIKTPTNEYTIIVRGDLNGTGDLELSDLAQAQKVYLQLIKDDNLKNLAIDLNKNGRTDLNDLARLQRIYIGK